MNATPSQNKDSTSAKGMLTTVALCLALYFGWNQYLKSKYPDYGQPKTTTEDLTPQTKEAPGVTSDSSAPSTTSAAAASPVAPATKAAAMPVSDLTYETGEAVYVFNQSLGSLSSVKLKGYREENQPQSPAIELLHKPLIVEATSDAKSLKRPQAADYSGVKADNVFTFTRQEGPWKITQMWTLPTAGFAAKLSTTFTNTSAQPVDLKPTVLFESGARIGSHKTSFFVPGAPNEASRFLTQADGSDDFHNLESFCKDQTTEVISKNKKLDFFGFDHHYFVAAFLPSIAADYRTSFAAADPGSCSVVTAATSDLGSIAPGQSASINWDAWFGPKEVELLSTFNPHLRTTLGLGWLDMIAHPLLLAIKGLHKFTGNYGIAIILLTLLLKIAFFPLAKQAAVSAARMKKFNPEMAKLRVKFKDDPQRMNMEVMKFMSTHKINPMKGCLPMLPTIPVFFALFRVLSASIDLRHAPFFGWIADLSAKDPYFVTPIILTVCMFVQQKLTPMTGMDPTQEKVMMMMPLIFGVMMISLPSGLVLYMLTNTIFTIMQQQYFNKKFAAID